MGARSMRVAILDDDPSIRSAIGRLLRTSNITVSTYATCMELFDSIATFAPDCLVLDLQMPGMTGMDVMQYLSQHGMRYPTIIITAHDEAGSREMCLGSGATAYLRKPLDADALFDAIGNAVDGAAGVDRFR
jgi:FixJ family two-component response regulator